MITLPGGALPVLDLGTREILYGNRDTTFRYELLQHDPATGLDSFSGILDGVTPGGNLSWTSNAVVKKSGTITVQDLQVAKPGARRISDVNLYTERIRPVMVIDGLPEIPLGVYVITASPEKWRGTGREWPLELHEKTTALEQDSVDVSFTAGTAQPVLEIIESVIEGGGERITIDGSDTRTLRNSLVWAAGTTRIRIVNDLLDAIGYNSLWMDGQGSFRATQYVRPVDRSTRYSMLNDADGEQLQRELVDGDQSIYSPEWTRDRDTYKVPNKVIAVAAGTGDDAPLTGTVTNENPDSPFSFDARGRWVTRVLDNVDVPDFSAEPDPAAATTLFLESRAEQALIAASSVQATVELSTLPIPLELRDVVIFASTPANIESRHTVQSVEVQLRFDGTMRLSLREVSVL